MTLPYQMIAIGGQEYRRFIPWPGPVTDNTSRCIACGQIDDEPWHDQGICHRSRTNPAKGLLIPADVEREAHRLGKLQRAVILSLSAHWGAASNHQAAKRLWYRTIRLVDHKHKTDNCWALTRHGEQVREYLSSVSGDAA